VRLLALLEKEKLIIIDELNNSFHPLLVRYLIGLFHSPDYNQKNAQLIFTTHETSVLDQEVFRRDQVWFCEKGNDQATRLFALLDFKPRKGYENLEAAYLAGRYGAVPLINTL
jgi:AAA15 family ATPase/GTPase